MGINITHCNCYGTNLAPKIIYLKKRVLRCFILPCFLPLNVSWSERKALETLEFLSNDEMRVSVSRLFLKCIWSDIFWHNLTCSISKLIDCKLLSSTNKNLAVILALKTAQCYLKWSGDWDEFVAHFHLVTQCCGQNWSLRRVSEAKQHVEQFLNWVLSLIL